MLMDFRDNVQKCHEYIHALEEERSKIQVFRRELPLCVELVTQAIEACKQQLSGNTNVECLNGHSECSEQTTSNEPVLEEFMPLINRSNSTDIDDENEHESKKQQMINNTQISNNDHDNRNDDDDDDDDDNNNDDELEKKSDWLRSVQLWNQTPDLPTTTHKENQPKRVSVVEIKKNGGAFHPFQKEKASTSGNNNSNNNNNKPSSAPAASACSSAEVAGGGGGKKEEKGGQSSRKARRCWSPELHRRFLHALQQLGGSHVATPKQIKEMMKVDGLTNDEVKSHLQKYRLHTRRPTPSIHNSTTTTQTPQFVVVGGIWMPAATTVGPSNGGVYAPVAAAPPPPTPAGQLQSHYCEERGSHSEGRRATTTTGRSSSPATSSSTHTTTASHAS